MHLWQFGTVTIAFLLFLLAVSSIFLLSEFFLLFYDFLSILFVSRFEGSLGPGFRQVHLTVRSARAQAIRDLWSRILCLRAMCFVGSRAVAPRNI